MASPQTSPPSARAQVGDAGERDDAAQAQGLRGARRGALGQPRPRREPERELPAGRVAEGDDAVQVERVLPRGLAQVVGAAPRLRACPASRPPVPEAPVLQAPRRVALGGESRREAAQLVEGPGRLPAAAVDEDHDRVRAGSVRQPQLGHLLRRRAVGDRVVGRRLRQRQQVVGGHEGLGGGGRGHEEQACGGGPCHSESRPACNAGRPGHDLRCRVLPRGRPR